MVPVPSQMQIEQTPDRERVKPSLSLIAPTDC
jgi:hypothetical protein